MTTVLPEPDSTPKRLSGGALLAIIMLSVVLIAPLVFVLALWGGGTESGKTMNGVPVPGPIGPLDVVVGIVLMILSAVLSALGFASALYILCSAEDRARTSPIAVFAQFLIATLIVMGAYVIAVLFIPTLAYPIAAIGSLLSVAVVVTRTVRASTLKRVILTFAVAIIASFIFWVMGTVLDSLFDIDSADFYA